MKILLMICVLIFFSQLPQPSECLTNQAVFRKRAQKYLANHVFDTKQAGSEFECGLYCVREESCASVNYKTSGIGKGRCELNNKTYQDTSDGDEETNPEFIHLIVEKVRKIDHAIIVLTRNSCMLYPRHFTKQVIPWASQI